MNATILSAPSGSAIPPDGWAFACTQDRPASQAMASGAAGFGAMLQVLVAALVPADLPVVAEGVHGEPGAATASAENLAGVGSPRPLPLTPEWRGAREGWDFAAIVRPAGDMVRWRPVDSVSPSEPGGVGQPADGAADGPPMSVPEVPGLLSRLLGGSTGGAGAAAKPAPADCGLPGRVLAANPAAGMLDTLADDGASCAASPATRLAAEAWTFVGSRSADPLVGQLMARGEPTVTPKDRAVTRPVMMPAPKPDLTAVVAAKAGDTADPTSEPGLLVDNSRIASALSALGDRSLRILWSLAPQRSLGQPGSPGGTPNVNPARRVTLAGVVGSASAQALGAQEGGGLRTQNGVEGKSTSPQGTGPQGTTPQSTSPESARPPTNGRDRVEGDAAPAGGSPDGDGSDAASRYVQHAQDQDQASRQLRGGAAIRFDAASSALSQTSGPAGQASPTVPGAANGASGQMSVPQAVFESIADQAQAARLKGESQARFDLVTDDGDAIRVRVAVHANVVSTRISVTSAAVRDVLTQYMPELSQRLETSGLIPDSIEVSLLGGWEAGSEKHGRREQPSRPSGGRQTDVTNPTLIEAADRGFEEWA